MKQKINENVASRPLLVEQEAERSKKAQFQAMKDISRMEKIFKESGLKNTDILFNAEEREKLQDIKFLEKHGFHPTKEVDTPEDAY